MKEIIKTIADKYFLYRPAIVCLWCEGRQRAPLLLMKTLCVVGEAGLSRVGVDGWEYWWWRG